MSNVYTDCDPRRCCIIGLLVYCGVRVKHTVYEHRQIHEYFEKILRTKYNFCHDIKIIYNDDVSS
jgi:hypothetical protein